MFPKPRRLLASIPLKWVGDVFNLAGPPSTPRLCWRFSNLVGLKWIGDVFNLASIRCFQPRRSSIHPPPLLAMFPNLVGIPLKWVGDVFNLAGPPSTPRLCWRCFLTSSVFP